MKNKNKNKNVTKKEKEFKNTLNSMYVVLNI